MSTAYERCVLCNKSGAGDSDFDHLRRFNRKWDDVIERMALRHVAHGRVTIEGREIVSRVEGKDASRNVGAIVQTILTLNSLILLSNDPREATASLPVP